MRRDPATLRLNTTKVLLNNNDDDDDGGGCSWRLHKRHCSSWSHLVWNFSIQRHQLNQATHPHFVRFTKQEFVFLREATALSRLASFDMRHTSNMQISDFAFAKFYPRKLCQNSRLQQMSAIVAKVRQSLWKVMYAMLASLFKEKVTLKNDFLELVLHRHHQVCYQILNICHVAVEPSRKQVGWLAGLDVVGC